jgi:ABC-2 type transport system ATP-binding protein
MVRIEQLTKQYGPTLALDRLTLDIPSGAVVGLLGPNGAGKTTLLRLLMGFVFPDAGTIDRGSLDPCSIGYLPEQPFYPPHHTVRGYLLAMAHLAGLRPPVPQRKVTWLLERLSLTDVAGRRLRACSRGMLQRVGVAQALLADPPLLLFDEPIGGLDPAGQKLIRDLIIALHQAGPTVVLSSHNLGEVTRVCTDVAMLSRGRLVRSGPLDSVLPLRPEVTIATSELPAGLAAQVRAMGPGVHATERWVILVGDGVAHKADILRLLLDAGMDICELKEQRATLEEIYLEATAE